MPRTDCRYTFSTATGLRAATRLGKRVSTHAVRTGELPSATPVVASLPPTEHAGSTLAPVEFAATAGALAVVGQDSRSYRGPSWPSRAGEHLAICAAAGLDHDTIVDVDDAIVACVAAGIDRHVAADLIARAAITAHHHDRNPGALDAARAALGDELGAATRDAVSAISARDADGPRRAELLAEHWSPQQSEALDVASARRIAAERAWGDARNAADGVRNAVAADSAAAERARNAAVARAEADLDAELADTADPQHRSAAERRWRDAVVAANGDYVDTIERAAQRRQVADDHAHTARLDALGAAQDHDRLVAARAEAERQVDRALAGDDDPAARLAAIDDARAAIHRITIAAPQFT
jgi:hypothetical protein